jgi:N-acylneuraminate cytidylyltransferase
MFQPEHFNTRSQDLEEAWHDAGQFYWGTTETWTKNKSVLGSNCRAVKLNKYEVVEVDEIEDMKLVETLLKAKI